MDSKNIYCVNIIYNCTSTYVVCRLTSISIANNRTRTIRAPTAIKLLIVLVLM